MSDPITLTGPHLTLADLRWLVSRCTDLPDSAMVFVRGADYSDPMQRLYEQIRVEPDTPAG